LTNNLAAVSIRGFVVRRVSEGDDVGPPSRGPALGHWLQGVKMMRFLSVYKTVERNTPPTLEEMTRMGKLIEEGMKSGWLLATEGCLPSALGAKVRKSGGKVTVTDGPFVEAKELIGGFAILQTNSKEEALALVREFLEVAGDGECELRQLHMAPAASQGNTAVEHHELSEQFAKG
jgi:hypothetical protein